MGILSFIVNGIIDCCAAQGDPNALILVKEREQRRELKRQKKEAKRRKKWWYGFQCSDTARLDECDVYTAATQDDTH